MAEAVGRPVGRQAARVPDRALPTAVGVERLVAGQRRRDEIGRGQGGLVIVARPAPFAKIIETGRLDTSAMVSRTIGLGDVNEAFRAMEAGEVIRSVINSF